VGWAIGYVAKLRAGETVSFRPRGDSMSPRIESGDLCTVEPVDPAALRAGDVVLCKVRGAEYLHLVKAVRGGLGDASPSSITRATRRAPRRAPARRGR
jgi:hypothetical protein